MNRRELMAIIAAAILTVAQSAIGLSLPRPAKSEDAYGVWLGYTIDGELYRIELLPEERGTIAVTSATQDDRASLYRIESWTLSPEWVLSVSGRGVDDFRGSEVVVDGRLGGTPSKLTIGDRKQWRRELILLNERQLLEQSRRTRERAK